MPPKMSAEELLAKLVSFDTVSAKSNLPLISFVQEYLTGHGVTSELVYDNTGQKAALHALIGPAEPGGVVLSGHTDVVPVEGQSWTTDPFTLTERDGKLYGRGTCDMNGFLAVALALVPDYVAAPLKRPVQLAFSYDEEVGFFGAEKLIEDMRLKLPPALCIVGEPSMMAVVTGHKSIAELQTSVRGHEVHSSINHTGVSAVMIAARLINWIDQQGQNNRAAAEAAGAAAPGNGFTPPWTTLHTGVIHGGTAHNITARDCSFTFDIRTIPSESNTTWLDRFATYCAEVEAEMKAIAPGAGITIDIRCNASGCRPETDGAAEHLARLLTGDNGTHVVSYATEAGLFQDAGYSTVVCGPGSIDQAHQPDEFLSRDQLAAAVKFQQRLCDYLAG